MDTRGEFIKTAVIGIIVGVAFTWWSATRGSAKEFVGFVDYAGYFFVRSAFRLAGIPAFFYQLVKTILTQRKIHKLK